MASSENAIRLTKSDVQGLEADPTGNRFYPVTEHKGLCVQVTKGGTKSWVLRYRFHGRQKIHTLGVFPSMTPDQARKRLDAARVKINSGIDPNQAKADERQAAAAAKHAAFTVEDLASRYIRDHIKVNNKPSWQAEATRLINKHILPALGKLPVTEVGPADISAMLFKIREKTPTQANRVRAVLRTMFGRAEEWEHRTLGSNPVAVVKQRSPEKKRERRLSDLELKSLGIALRASKESPHVLAAFRLALLAGMRKGEIQGLHWEWVDLKAAEVRLPREEHKTGKKTGKARVVHLCAALVAVLKVLPKIEDCPYVVPGLPERDGEGKVLRWRPFVGLQNPMERVRKAAGLAKKEKPTDDDPGWHDLRRTFASVGSDLGLKGFMGELLGHAEQTVTDVYTRTAAQRLKEAAESVGARIDGILTGAIDPEKEETSEKKALSD